MNKSLKAIIEIADGEVFLYPVAEFVDVQYPRWLR